MKLFISSCICLLLPFSNAWAVNYKVTGELVDLSNSHGADNFYHNDVLPNFDGIWNVDTTKQMFRGKSIIDDINLVTLVQLGRLKLEAVVAQRGVSQSFNGKGVWDEANKEFTYDIAIGESNSGVASKADGSLSCNGHRLICRSVKNSNLDWEGMSLRIKFDQAMASFSGKMTVYEVSGHGLTKSETKLLYNVSGEVN